MKAELNSIENPYFIKLSDNVDFAFLEENLDLESPVSDYYLKYSDLSVNISVSLKWFLHGYFFINSAYECLDDDEYTIDLKFKDSLDDNISYEKKNKILLVDDVQVRNIDDLKKLVYTEYSKPYYTQNSTIHFKLKVNIFEFVWLQNAIFPRLVYYV